jgi:hypothetical protein
MTGARIPDPSQKLNGKREISVPFIEMALAA